MTGMMDNPEFLRSMSDMMSRPEVIDQVSTLDLQESIADYRSSRPTHSSPLWPRRSGV